MDALSAVRVLVTGLHGTVAPVLADALRAAGAAVVGWDRGADPPESAEAVAAVVAREAPDWVCHVATGPEAWAGWIAEACAAQARRLLFTSTASVFAPQRFGAPRITVGTPPDATDDYGAYKRRAEDLVRAASPRALVPRLAWQIGPSPGTNTLDQWLQREHDAHGVLRLSRRWTPAAAWLADTADALVGLIRSDVTGTVHLDANPGLSVYDLAQALRGASDWRIEPCESPSESLLLRDARIELPAVTERLAARRRGWRG